MTSPSQHGNLAALRTALEAVAVATDAPPMAAYLKNQFGCLGVKSPARRAAQKPTIAAGKGASGADLIGFATELWQQPEREFQYVACDLLRRWAKALGPDELAGVRGLLTNKAWWDTVDILAVHVVGTMVRRHPELLDTMDRWIDDEHLWLARTAILHQLTYKGDTDEARLFRYVERRAPDTDFFLRKACGWALRQHGRVAPQAVRDFVAAHEGQLSGLTRREALKHLG